MIWIIIGLIVVVYTAAFLGFWAGRKDAIEQFRHHARIQAATKPPPRPHERITLPPDGTEWLGRLGQP